MELNADRQVSLPSNRWIGDVTINSSLARKLRPPPSSRLSLRAVARGGSGLDTLHQGRGRKLVAVRPKGPNRRPPRPTSIWTRVAGPGLHYCAGAAMNGSISRRPKRNSGAASIMSSFKNRGEILMSLRSLAILLSISVLAMGAGIARAQSASTTARQALGAFPCPSGDSSCGNGAAPAPKPLKRKHRKHAESAELNSDGSNPNQKIEAAPPNDPQYDDPGPEQ